MEQLFKQFKTGLAFLALTLCVFAVSYPIIVYNMFYPEQALIYVANQYIHSWKDLLHIYLHPMLFHVTVPFFRPSGHFLLYQLITPWVGWHNNKIFILINLVFLAGTGVCLIKLYQRLFPSLIWGGYIAFAIYLMHPSLSLSRIITLHFEFAYIFFSSLSLYFFIKFLANNKKALITLSEKNTQPTSLGAMKWLAYALLFYFIAITFKEAALIQGVLLIIYLIFFLYQHDDNQPLAYLKKRIFTNKENRNLLLLLLVMTATFCAYLSLSWQTPLHPSLKTVNANLIYLGIKQCLKLLFGLGDYHHFYVDPNTGVFWRKVIFPFYTQTILMLCLIVSCLAAYFLFASANNKKYNNWQKPYFFLISAAVICAIIPIRWALVFPWHLSQSLIYLSLLFGFSMELIVKRWLLPLKYQTIVLSLIALIIGVSGFGVNEANVNRYRLDHDLNFELELNRNAILNPPKLNIALNEETLLVVADKQVGLGYMFGAGQYPLQFYDAGYIRFFDLKNNYLFLPTPAKHGGNLFKWAYLNPFIHEEVMPMNMAAINKIPNEYIYEWMKHEKNLVFLTYDDEANWHDSTASFMPLVRKVFNEKHIHINQYHQYAITAFKHRSYYVIDLPVGDVNLCEYQCSQEAMCTGFNFINVKVGDYLRYQCQLLSDTHLVDKKICVFCSAYVKNI